MKLAIVIGATRQGRQTPKQAEWIKKAAQDMGDVEAELLDLKEFDLPVFDEPISPRYNPDRVIDSKVKPWLNKLQNADAYVFVTPEYNHSIPGVLKNAIDYVTWELSRKPVLIASHGSVGGARAAMHLKEILSESKTVVIPPAVAVAHMSDLIDEDGNLNEEAKDNPYGPQSQLQSALEELKWYSGALSSARK